MASKVDQQSVEALKEVIRLLKLSLDSCQKALEGAERSVRYTGQDNRPADLN